MNKYVLGALISIVIGARIDDPGSLNGRFSSLAFLLSDLRAGPPIRYVNTVALVMKPTNLYQLGNGAKNTIPTISDTINGITGMRLFWSTFSMEDGR